MQQLLPLRSSEVQINDIESPKPYLQKVIKLVK